VATSEGAASGGPASGSAITPVTMPKFGLAMTEGKVAGWIKPEGAVVSPGDELADIETSKITNAYESPAKGILRRHVAPVQQDLPVGALIAVITDESVSDGEIEAFVAQFQAEFAARQEAGGSEEAATPITIEAGGRRIRYLEMGTDHGGAPVVLVHGFGGDLNGWLFNQGALAERHHVLALDLPGHGESTKSVGSGDLATLSAALVAFLDALGCERAHLAGHSLGGAIALRTALDHPTRVASLALICPAGFGAEINDAFTGGLVAASKRKQLQPVLEMLFANPELVSRDMVENMLRAKRLDGAQQALEAIDKANFAGGRQAESLVGRLGEVRVPVQLIWGAEDKIIPAAHASTLPPNIHVNVLPGTGHMPHMERAAEVNRILLDFLASGAGAA
jgi:pyruvate dehydrogenase E2 component (dihydrolipoamide acetyltransferase)